MLAKHLLLTGALVATTAIKCGKDVSWYASRKLNDPCRPGSRRPASAR